ncbi:hypothetical protein BKA56DRAFT_621526 [Ilyonectria sp. MPI-CAGE-AT-0026]|nr:hypothetical protein BKA56DRAFT_621526 [Ilyonectria sp. MPI-CAGE-AT-0026]
MRMSVKAIARFSSSQASLELLPGKLSSAAYGTPPQSTASTQYSHVSDARGAVPSPTETSHHAARGNVARSTRRGQKRRTHVRHPRHSKHTPSLRKEDDRLVKTRLVTRHITSHPRHSELAHAPPVRRTCNRPPATLSGGFQLASGTDPGGAGERRAELSRKRPLPLLDTQARARVMDEPVMNHEGLLISICAHGQRVDANEAHVLHALCSSDGSDASQPQPLSLSVELGLAWTALNSPEQPCARENQSRPQRHTPCRDAMRYARISVLGMELLGNGATFGTGVTLYRGVGTFDTTPILAGPWCEIPSSPTGRIIQTVCPDVLMNLIPLLIVHGLADTASHAWSGSLAPWLGSLYFTLSGLPVKDSHIRLRCNPSRPLPCHTLVILSPSALAVLVYPCLSLSCT